jgi:hypothetical protein
VTDAASSTRKGRQTLSRRPAQEDSTVKDGSATTCPASKQNSKIGKVIALLQREQGATLDEMVVVTGWLPHTTRAALTGLKKKGHTIERSKRGETSCYRTKTGA